MSVVIEKTGTNVDSLTQAWFQHIIPRIVMIIIQFPVFIQYCRHDCSHCGRSPVRGECRLYYYWATSQYYIMYTVSQ